MDHIILLFCTLGTFLLGAKCNFIFLNVEYLYLYLYTYSELWNKFGTTLEYYILGCSSIAVNTFDPLGSCLKDSSGSTRATFSLELIIPFYILFQGSCEL